MTNDKGMGEMLIDRIEELREKINKQIVSDNADKEEILVLSNELDRCIVDYLKNKDNTKGNPNLSDKSELFRHDSEMVVINP